MAKKNTESEIEKVVKPEDQLGALLKTDKADHFNFEEDHKYKVPCSSLLLTSTLNGGLTAGAHRFMGLASGGKTSCALDFMYHFLKDQKKNSRRGVYIKAEGRLSDELQDRSGIKFVKDYEQWKDGTCFVYECNIYESVFKLKRELITTNPLNVEYFFITDSADGLIKRDDCNKSEEESQTVGGGSLITSTFLKKVGLAMGKRGHIDIYISQIREQIKINQYEVTIPKQGKASGPRALEHAVDIAIEFLPRFGGDLITEGEKGSKTIGHFCKCRILKSANEKNGVEVKYPIRYGQKNANSVWTSYELVDLLMVWQLLKKKGAWLPFDEKFRAELATDLNKEIPEQLHGIQNVRDWVEENTDVQEYLFNKFKDLSF